MDVHLRTVVKSSRREFKNLMIEHVYMNNRIVILSLVILYLFLYYFYCSRFIIFVFYVISLVC